MLEDIIKERLKKRRPEHYPARVQRAHSIDELIKNFSKFSKSKKVVFAVGRVLGLRVQGGLMFLDIRDESGKIQAVVKKESLANFSDLKNTADIGDFVEVSGPLFQTKRGEKSIDTRSARIIVKALRPLPSVWHGLKEVEERYRKRYLDLLLNNDTKEKLT
ncbi:MAG: OB-fold nucleic acid binding domain-containing protein, partial [Patescibacteria group bacterium]